VEEKGAKGRVLRFAKGAIVVGDVHTAARLARLAERDPEVALAPFTPNQRSER
jgi:hypothetical protein